MHLEVQVVAISDARLDGALSLRSRVAIKCELQRLIRAHSAATAFVWLCSSRGHRTTALEYAGDPNGLPRSGDLGGCAVVCEQRNVLCADQEPREVVLLHQRLCVGAPMLVLGLVESRAQLADVLVDDIERALDCIEAIIVDTLDPIRGEQARTRGAPRPGAER